MSNGYDSLDTKRMPGSRKPHKDDEKETEGREKKVVPKKYGRLR